MLSYCAASVPRSANLSNSTKGTTVAVSPRTAAGVAASFKTLGTTNGTIPCRVADCSTARSASHDARKLSVSQTKLAAARRPGCRRSSTAVRRAAGSRSAGKRGRVRHDTRRHEFEPEHNGLRDSGRSRWSDHRHCPLSGFQECHADCPRFAPVREVTACAHDSKLNSNSILGPGRDRCEWPRDEDGLVSVDRDDS